MITNPKKNFSQLCRNYSTNFFRHNIATQEWVVYSTGRKGRPKQFGEGLKSEPNLLAFDPACPFCPGNENLTGTPTYSYRQGRVIRNKYPVVHHALEEDKFVKPTPLVSQREKSQLQSYGYHEVIIETDAHNRDLVNGAGVDYIESMFMCFLGRGKIIASDDRVHQILMFKNNGKNAGASIKHSHSQIVGLPIIPSSVSQHLSNAKIYFQHHQECPFCQMITDEINDSKSEEHNRVVKITDNFIAFLPYASRIPNQIWILPRVHDHNFFNLKTELVQDLSEVVYDVMGKVVVSEDHNCQTSPVNQSEHFDFMKYYHWYVEIVPRMSSCGGFAGFEMGSGMMSCSSLPEDNARRLLNLENKS